jgi:hypothetical protein
MKRSRAPQPATFSVQPLTGDAAYNAAVDALTDMRKRLRAAEAERDERLYSGAPVRDAKDARVASLLGETGPDDHERETRLAILNRDIADILEAIVVLQQRVNAARVSASAEIVEQVRPEWNRRACALAKAVQAAIDAHLDFEALRTELIAADIAFAGPLPVLSARKLLGQVNDAHTDAKRFVDECRLAGVLEAV